MLNLTSQEKWDLLLGNAVSKTRYKRERFLFENHYSKDPQITNFIHSMGIFIKNNPQAITCYPVDFILSPIRDIVDRREFNLLISLKVPLPSGNHYRITTPLITYAVDGMTCRSCGIQGSHFIETFIREDMSKMALYGFHEGKLVEFTCDHIVPVSKGGFGGYPNTQTMCRLCNNRKGNTLSHPVKSLYRIADVKTALEGTPVYQRFFKEYMAEMTNRRSTTGLFYGFLDKDGMQAYLEEVNGKYGLQLSIESFPTYLFRD